MAEPHTRPLEGKLEMDPRQIDEIKTMATMQLLVQQMGEQIKLIVNILDGTVERRGLRDRLTLAEQDIKLNREAWEAIKADLRTFEASMNKTLQESFLEVKTEFDRKFDTITSTNKEGKIDLRKIWVNNVVPALITTACVALFLAILGIIIPAFSEALLKAFVH